MVAEWDVCQRHYRVIWARSEPVISVVRSYSADPGLYLATAIGRLNATAISVVMIGLYATMRDWDLVYRATMQSKANTE